MGGGSNGAGRPEVGGWRCSWVEATTSKSDFRSTCYASGSMALHPHIYMCVCVYIYIYIHTHIIYTYIHIYIYIYIHTLYYIMYIMYILYLCIYECIICIPSFINIRIQQDKIKLTKYWELIKIFKNCYPV